MLIPPPLPDTWPFMARGNCCAENMATDSNLPGLSGVWRIFSTAALTNLKETLPLEGLYGRGGLIQAEEYILRPYRRGGLVRHFNRNIYPTANRFQNEYDIHIVLWNAGFPTVEPVGYAYRRRFWGVEGVYITKRADAVPWPKVWCDIDPAIQARQIASLIKPLAGWGLWSPDMNATNFLLKPDGQMLALDWDRAKWTLKYCLLEKYWMRLKRSMYKLNAPATLIDLIQLELTGDPK